MSRNRSLTASQSSVVIERLRRGDSPAALAREFGVSKRTIERERSRIEKVVERVAPVPAPSQALDAEEQSIPEGASPEFVQRQIARVEAMVAEAHRTRNVPAFASLMQRLIALMAHQHRTAPAPPSDPNANPDMIEARDRCRAAMHELIDQALAAK